MERPYVICHMGSSVDGRIISEHWGDNKDKYAKLYEQCHNTFDSDAWMVGRVTMEKDFTEGRQPAIRKSDTPLERKPFIGDKDASSFAIVADPKGKLGWEANEIDGDHIIGILSEGVSDGYLEYLQEMGISYIFAGKHDLDFKVALKQLHAILGIKKLMLEGGGNINGSLLNAGLIDELSLLILPLADGISETPTTFEINYQLSKPTAGSLKLVDVQKLQYDVLWLKYQFDNVSPVKVQTSPQQ